MNGGTRWRVIHFVFFQEGRRCNVFLAAVCEGAGGEEGLTDARVDGEDERSVLRPLK